MARYTIYQGKLVCQSCGLEVKTMRLYPDTKEVSWMCSSKHLSKLKLIKEKKDYEREKREQEDRG
jgi:hypothetical protein